MFMNNSIHMRSAQGKTEAAFLYFLIEKAFNPDKNIVFVTKTGDVRSKVKRFNNFLKKAGINNLKVVEADYKKALKSII
ncbi:MAG: hypothetical protein DRG69_09535 [Deltaproteobacteria bacterium]|nr:MAG: hypothetical protein DRG69_09535 [Deltaproteobacteria bacterium]